MVRFLSTYLDAFALGPLSADILTDYENHTCFSIGKALNI